MTKHSREKASTALLDVCLIVAEDGQRRMRLGRSATAPRNPAAAALIAWAPAALREHGVRGAGADYRSTRLFGGRWSNVHERLMRGEGDASCRLDTIRRLTAAVPQAHAMLAGMQLEVFTALAGGAGAADLTTNLNVPQGRLLRLLDALVVVGLLERRDGQYSNAPEASAFLVKGGANDLTGSQELIAQLWRADLMTAHSIRTGAPAALHDFRNASDEDMLAMLRGMHPTPLPRAAISQSASISRIAVRSPISPGVQADSSPLFVGRIRASAACSSNCRALLRLRAESSRPSPAEKVSKSKRETSSRRRRGRFSMPSTCVHWSRYLGPVEAARAIANAALALRPGGWLYIVGGGELDNDRLGPPMAVFF
jgi:Dimerisation domain